MLASILVATLIATLILSTFRVRRREGGRDSITRFADARKAMSVTQGKPALREPKVTPHELTTGSASSGVVVRSGSATLLDPIARRHVAESRRSFRRDPEVLARRPTVALLPRLLTSRCGTDANPLTQSCETDGKPPVVSLSAPESEAS